MGNDGEKENVSGIWQKRIYIFSWSETLLETINQDSGPCLPYGDLTSD